MNPWRDHAVPAMRHEALYGDRVVRCFAERPASLRAMFEPRAPGGRNTTRSSAKAGAGATTRPVRAGERIAAGLGRARHRRRRPRHALSLQPPRVRVRAAGGAAARRDRRAGRRARAAARASPTSPTSAARRRSSSTTRWPIASRKPTRRPTLRHSPAGLGPRRGRSGRGVRPPAQITTARDRRRRDPLHLGHDRPSEGRDAHPPRDRPLGAALRGLHAPRRPTTARRWRCRRATSPG